MKKYQTVKEYLADFEEPIRQRLGQIMNIIEDEIPGSEQTFAYGIPTYKLSGKNVVHFAAYNTHIGFYPGSKPIAAFKAELKDFNTSKGTIQLPLDKHLPLALIRKIVRFAKENNVK